MKALTALVPWFFYALLASDGPPLPPGIDEGTPREGWCRWCGIVWRENLWENLGLCEACYAEALELAVRPMLLSSGVPNEAMRKVWRRQ